eukprot:6471685-Amphidinium_carterae.2
MTTDVYSLVRASRLQGELVKLEWLAELKAGQLFWQAARVLTLLGYDGTTPDRQHWSGFRVQRKTLWTKLCSALSLNIDEHFPLSSKSRKRRGSAASSSAEAPDQSSLSSIALVLTCAAFASARQQIRHRALAGHCLRALLDAANTPQESLLETTPSVKCLCEQDIDEENFCKHLAPVLGSAFVRSSDENEDMASTLIALCTKTSCAACCEQLRLSLHAVATSLDAARSEWSGYGESMQALRGPTGRKRNADKLELQTILRPSSTDDDQKRYWMSKCMVGLLERAAAAVEKEPQVLWLSTDGGRFGRPQAERLISWLEISSLHAVVLLPPMVCHRGEK